MKLAERAANPTHSLEAHETLGLTLFQMGEYAAARAHLEQGVTLTDPAAQQTLAIARRQQAKSWELRIKGADPTLMACSASLLHVPP